MATPASVIALCLTCQQERSTLSPQCGTTPWMISQLPGGRLRIPDHFHHEKDNVLSLLEYTLILDMDLLLCSQYLYQNNLHGLTECLPNVGKPYPTHWRPEQKKRWSKGKFTLCLTVFEQESWSSAAFELILILQLNCWLSWFPGLQTRLELYHETS